MVGFAPATTPIPAPFLAVLPSPEKPMEVPRMAGLDPTLATKTPPPSPVALLARMRLPSVGPGPPRDGLAPKVTANPPPSPPEAFSEMSLFRTSGSVPAAVTQIPPPKTPAVPRTMRFVSPGTGPPMVGFAPEVMAMPPPACAELPLAGTPIMPKELPRRTGSVPAPVMNTPPPSPAPVMSLSASLRLMSLPRMSGAAPAPTYIPPPSPSAPLLKKRLSSI